MFNVKDIEANKSQFKYLAWNMREVQLLFEYFCLWFKAAAPRMDKFMTL